MLAQSTKAYAALASLFCIRACLHGGGAPQVEVTRLGWVKKKPSFTCHLACSQVFTDPIFSLQSPSSAREYKPRGIY